jgi:two-component system chemotaxis response regulator CheB
VPRDIVVIGTSAGGVEALTQLATRLPSTLPAALFAVLHIGRTRSMLPEILSRSSPLPVVHPADGDPIQHGRIVVAPPDFHMTLEADRIRLIHGPAENGARPAIDPLFRSAADVFGDRVVGVILTGALDDGVAGLVHVKQAGGLAVVQDPHEAAMPGMPQAALRHVDADYVAPLHDIPRILARVVTEGQRSSARTRGGTTPMSSEAQHEPERGRRSALTCPACAGALWELDEKGLLLFRCRVGHQYSADAMLSEQGEALDRALWAGLRALEERAALHDRLAGLANERGQWRAADQFRGRAEQVRHHARALRGILTDPAISTADEVPDRHEDLPKSTDVPS